MNPVEIEEAVSQLASAPFDAAELPYSFLTAFGYKPTTILGLRTGTSNKPDLPAGYDPDGDGAAAAIQFATLAPGLALTHEDFLGGP